MDNNYCNFHPILQENDVGIDGQIEIFNEDKTPKGEMIFVQIKTGNSYYKNKKCIIPIDGHADYWKSLKLSVIGVVCLLDKTNRNVINAYWVDIKKYLSNYEGEKLSSIVFSANKCNEFNQEFFLKYFVPFVENRMPNIGFDEAKQLLVLGNSDKQLGIRMLCQKHAQYIESWEILFNEYKLGMDSWELPFFYDSISYAFSHPDHFYINGYYELSDKAKAYIKTLLYEFSISDIIAMLSIIEEEEIQRGTIGQTIEILISNIRDSNKKLLDIMGNKEISDEVRKRAEVILAYHAPALYKANIRKLDATNNVI